MKQTGYTLIEILVALTIIGIIFGLGYANFRGYSRKQILLGTVRQMQGDLRLAQEKALAGVKPSPDCDDYALVGYQFRADPPNNRYFIEAVCPSAASWDQDAYVCESDGSYCGRVENCKTGVSNCFLPADSAKTTCDNACLAGGTGFGVLESVLIKQIDIPADITLQSISYNPVVFKVLGLGTNITAGTSSEIVLSQASTGNEQTVIVSSGGEIK